MDMLNGDRDHQVATVEIQFEFVHKTQNQVQRVCPYDRIAARAKLECQDSQDVKPLSPVAWECGAQQHWSTVRSEVMQHAIKTFPKQTRQQRQLYFTSETWGMICKRKDLRAHYRQLRRDKILVVMRQCFNAWKNQEHDPTALEDMYIHQLNMQEAMVFEQRQDLDSQYRQAKKNDWKHWVATQIRDKIDRSQESRGTDVFKIFQPKKIIQRHQGLGKRGLPGLKDGEGQWRYSQHSVAQAWQDQFSRIENAVPTNMKALQQMSTANHTQRDLEFLREIPTLYDVERSIRMLNVSKASGADQMGAELLKLRMPHEVQKLYAFFLKLSIRGQAVPEMTGGWLVPLWKGKASQQHMANYRAILLEPVLSRAYSRSWRPKLEAALSTVAAPLQSGGKKGMSVEAMRLQIRLWMHDAAVQHKSIALFFVDLKSAFYTVIKQFLAERPVSDATMKEVFRFVNLPQCAYDEFVHQLHDPCSVQKATKSTAVAEMVQATLAHTWICVPGGDTVYRPQTGSRPGDPAADLMFSFIVAKILDAVNMSLADKGVFQHVRGQDLMLSQSVTWVDDMCFVIHGKADVLEANVCLVIAEILEVLSLHGFQVTYGPGKTAVMIQFRGTKSQDVRQDFERRCLDVLSVMTEFNGMVKVPIVTHYKHLGAFVDKSANFQAEVRVRAAQASSKMHPLKKV